MTSLVPVFAAAIALGLIVLAFTIRIEMLPPLALFLYVLLPIAYIPTPPLLKVFTPSALVFLVWALRTITIPRRRSLHPAAPRTVPISLLLPLGLFCLWSALGVSFSSSPQLTQKFTTALILMVLLPILSAANSAASTMRLLTPAWAWLAVPLSFYALLERLTGTNPVLASMYASPPYPLVQHWAVYRVTTTLGHPLSNMVFFSVAFALSIALVLDNPTTRGRFIPLIASTLGIAFTVSRTGVLAAAAAAVFSLLLAFRRRTPAGPIRSRSFNPVLMTGFALLLMSALFASPLMQYRQDSLDAISSSDFRWDLFRLAARVVGSYHGLGTGAGTSGITMARAGLPSTVENSFLQILIGLGYPGLILFVLILLTAFAFSIRRGNTPIALGLLAFSISVAGFNWIESNLSGMALLGLLLAAAVDHRPPGNSSKAPYPPDSLGAAQRVPPPAPA